MLVVRHTHARERRSNASYAERHPTYTNSHICAAGDCCVRIRCVPDEKFIASLAVIYLAAWIFDLFIQGAAAAWKRAACKIYLARHCIDLQLKTNLPADARCRKPNWFFHWGDKERRRPAQNPHAAWWWWWYSATNNRTLWALHYVCHWFSVSAFCFFHMWAFKQKRMWNVTDVNDVQFIQHQLLKYLSAPSKANSPWLFSAPCHFCAYVHS